jgi:hypothetical protein
MPSSVNKAVASMESSGLGPQKVSGALVGRGKGIAGTVDGTVVVMSTLVAASGDHDRWELVAVVGSTALVIWVAHVYAHGVGESIGLDRGLDWPAFRGIIGRQLPMLAAALAPIVVLALGAGGLFGEAEGVWLALAIGWLTLGVQGVRYARVEQLGRLGTVAIIAVNLALGGVVIGLKVLIA